MIVEQIGVQADVQFAEQKCHLVTAMRDICTRTLKIATGKRNDSNRFYMQKIIVYGVLIIGYHKV